MAKKSGLSPRSVIIVCGCGAELYCVTLGRYFYWCEVGTWGNEHECKKLAESVREYEENN